MMPARRLRQKQQPCAIALVLMMCFLCDITRLSKSGHNSVVSAFAPQAFQARDGRRYRSSACPPLQPSHQSGIITRLSLSNTDSDTKGDGAADEDTKKSKGLRRLAQLSLEDYKWRSSLFKTQEADRKVEESLARMMGDEATYVRPMDAQEAKRGPLGRMEKAWVEWLETVFDEEARRAKEIVKSEGTLVRPKDSVSNSGELGPLGAIEKAFVDFIATIRLAETERVSTKTLRPMDLDETKRGPLGEAELKAVTAIRQVLKSEKMRMDQSRKRGWDVVRPIDVPGPLGDFEMAVIDVIRTEQQRKLEGESKDTKFLRPKDSAAKGILGELEQSAVDAVKSLTEEEKERLRNIQRVLDENRPMETNRLSVLGIVEAITVGIIRAPLVITEVFKRVEELLKSETLDGSSKASKDGQNQKQEVGKTGKY